MFFFRKIYVHFVWNAFRMPEIGCTQWLWIQSIRWINIYCYKFYMLVWLTNLFSMADALQYFRCWVFSAHCFFPFLSFALLSIPFHVVSNGLSAITSVIVIVALRCAAHLCSSLEKCEFHTKMNWNRLRIHILRRTLLIIRVHIYLFLLLRQRLCK